MSILTNLLKTYEYCEENNLVDKYSENDAVLLPIYHQSIKAQNMNLLEVTLDENGNVLQTKFPKDITYIFPVTEDSVARSSNVAPHPIEDKMQYCINEIADPVKYDSYLIEFDSFYNYLKQGEVKDFMSSIRLFIANKNSYDDLMETIQLPELVKHDGGKIEYKTSSGRTKEYNFGNTFICFKVRNSSTGEYRDVNNFYDLHRIFINYIDDMSKGKSGQCNISGDNQILTEKHRCLLGTAKIISVSNNVETYLGRFRTGSDIIRVGRKTSEKIHLMIKYLLENRNSCKSLAENLFLVNWFMDDVKNENGFNLTDNETWFDGINLKEIENIFDETAKLPVSTDNAKIGDAFSKGSNKLSPKSNYYLMLIDKSSNGRISIKYNREMTKSQLVGSLENWQKKYVWERYDNINKKYICFVPNFYSILISAYGVERDKWLVLDNENFKKDQYQNLILSMLDNKSVPMNIKKALSKSIRNRHCYNNQWNFVLSTALAVLSEGRKEFISMRPQEEQTRSFLFGRLLAVYEKIELDVLSKNVNSKDKKNKDEVDDEGSNEKNRTTNASRLWNAYVNKPDSTVVTLEQRTKVYANKLMGSEKQFGSYVKAEKAKEEIAKLFEEKGFWTVKKNTPLDDDFIFGYYSQKKDLYSRKNGEVSNE